MLRFISIISLSALSILATATRRYDGRAPEPRITQGLPKEIHPPSPARRARPSVNILVDDTANQVLVLLEQLTDKIILRRQDLPVSKFEYNSGAIQSGKPINCLESLLTLNGIMLTDMGGRFEGPRDQTVEFIMLAAVALN